MSWEDLKDNLMDVISLCCDTEEDKEKAKKYFDQVTVNQLIDEATE